MNENKQLSEKPIEIKCMEFKQSLEYLINTSELPPFIMIEILNNMFLQVKMLSDEIYRGAMKNYVPHNMEEEKCQDTTNNKLD